MCGMLKSDHIIMKEIHSRIICFLPVICTFLMFCACETEQNTEMPEKYFFSNAGVTFSVGDDCDEIIRRLGEPNSKTDAPSCAGVGSDEVYVYSGFRIYGYRNDGECGITSIELTNDNVSTAEGLHIGDLEEKMRAIYGDGEIFGGGTEYCAENCRLRFFIRDGKIVSIKYVEI